MFDFLRKKVVDNRFNKLDNSLTFTFSNIKNDIDSIKKWVIHLNKKSAEIDTYKEHLTLTKEDVKNLNLWITYLEGRHNNLHSYVLDLHKNDKELFERVQKLEEIKEKHEKIILNASELVKNSSFAGQGQLGTLQGTSKGQVEDKSLEKTPQETKVKTPKKLSILDKEAFTGAEMEILDILYSSDRPISYDKISKIVGKKEKSIRNLIYEIRRKGIDILTKPIGIRQKGFYLPQEEKIKVSGR